MSGLMSGEAARAADADAVCPRCVRGSCGLELVSDLLLVDGLLRIVKPSRVRLHAKDCPVFVSDVTPADVHTAMWLQPARLCSAACQPAQPRGLDSRAAAGAADA